MKRDLLTSAFERLHSRLLQRARNVVANNEEARDVLQEAFYRLWKSQTDVQHDLHATGLLIKTVNRLSIDTYRHSRNYPIEPITDTADDIPNDDNDERATLYETVSNIISKHLSARDRDILLRRDRDGWEFKELAEEYCITEANVRMIVARARRTVREIYRKSYTTESIKTHIHK